MAEENKKINDITKKLEDYSDFLDASITQYEKIFKEDYGNFKVAASHIAPSKEGDNLIDSFERLEKMKIADIYNGAAVAASTALEVLNSAKDALYELFPEMKAYSESKIGKEKKQ